LPAIDEDAVSGLEALRGIAERVDKAGMKGLEIGPWHSLVLPAPKEGEAAASGSGPEADIGSGIDLIGVLAARLLVGEVGALVDGVLGLVAVLLGEIACLLLEPVEEAHVHSFIEVDFTQVDNLRKANKARWAGQGAKVSFTAFVVWACSRVLREFPMINGTISGNNLIYRGNVNIGIAVDLDPGLIVPVVHDADELSLVGIAKRIVDLADRARSRRLNPEEIQVATFSITNPGVLGTMAGTPIIPKGTNGILGTGHIEKRVVVVEDPETGTDLMAIRKRAIFTLGYDHRMVDGADAARFLARLKELMEGFPEDA